MSTLTLQQSVDRCRGWACAEESLYETVGSWVASTPEPGPKIYFDACSQHHAWRAALWQQRLPQEVPRDRAGLTPAARAALSGIAAAGAPAKLAVYCRVVLARAAVAYGAWRRQCSPVSDRPIARALGTAKADVVADWLEGEEILQSLISYEQDALAVARAVGEAEALLVGHGLVLDV
jgi:hypothetical protein